MLFLQDDSFNTGSPLAHRGDNYSVAPLAVASKELPYLRADALTAEFKGLNSVFQFLQQHVPKPLRDGSSDGSKDGFYGRRDFYFFKNYAEATETYLHNPSSVRKFDEKDETLDGGEESGKQVEYDLVGDYIDIDRFIEGVPEVFGQMTNGNPRARRVWIVVNLSWVSHTAEEVINARCRRLARLVDWLESQQIRVQLTGIESTQIGHFEIQIKDFDEPLDLNDIAVVSHSDFLRRILFRLKEYSGRWEDGYGQPQLFGEALSKQAFEPQYNTEYSVFADNKVRTQTQVDADFDDLENLLTDVLVDDNAAVDKRSIAILR